MSQELPVLTSSLGLSHRAGQTSDLSLVKEELWPFYGVWFFLVCFWLGFWFGVVVLCLLGLLLWVVLAGFWVGLGFLVVVCFGAPFLFVWFGLGDVPALCLFMFLTPRSLELPCRVQLPALWHLRFQEKVFFLFCCLRIQLRARYNVLILIFLKRGGRE